jgi:anti-sigma-K factor RskA
MNMPPRDVDEVHGGRQDPPSDDDLLAGEYALGVLDADERRRVQARLDSDRDFAALVMAWEQRLHPLLDEFPAEEAPAAAWPSIRRRLGWDREAERDRESGYAGATAGRNGGLWRSLGFWRAAAGLGLAVAIGVIVVDRTPQPGHPVSPLPEEQAARPVTTLARDDGRPGWLASVDPAAGKVLMVPVPGAADAQGRVPELWVIAPGEPARSLGLVSIDRSHTVAVPEDLRRALAAGSTLAITLEPPGGAPAGVATGPIIAKGQITLG